MKIYRVPAFAPPGMYTDASLLLCEKDRTSSEVPVRLASAMSSTGRTGKTCEGAGMPLAFVLHVTTAMVGGTSVNFHLETADNLSSGNIGSTNRRVYPADGGCHSSET